MPIADETGLIVDIGNWVMNSACAQMKQWRAAGYKLPCVAVNISARQLFDQSFIADVEAIMNQGDIDGRSVVFEITESCILSENPLTERAINCLSEMGIALALDDFGTGYSSLSHLRRFKFNFLKIDRSFIWDIGKEPADEQLVRAIISLAKDLGIETIAEGVETQSQLEFLRAQSCDRIQGYLFGKPVAADEFEKHLRRTQETLQPV